MPLYSYVLLGLQYHFMVYDDVDVDDFFHINVCHVHLSRSFSYGELYQNLHPCCPFMPGNGALQSPAQVRQNDQDCRRVQDDILGVDFVSPMLVGSNRTLL